MFLRESYEASLARGPSIAENCVLSLLGGVTVLWALGICAKKGTLLSNLNLLAFIVGFTLISERLLPRLEERIADHHQALEALARQVERGASIKWPVSVGSFTFMDSTADEGGVVLFSEGQALAWNHGREIETMYRWSLIPVGHGWFVEALDF
jgi:hypothetical protein